MNSNSMSTFHRVSQERLPNTQEASHKEDPQHEASTSIDKRNIVGQLEASYTYQEPHSMFNKNKMIQLVSHKNGEANQIQTGHLAKDLHQESYITSPHDHPSRPVYRQK